MLGRLHRSPAAISDAIPVRVPERLLRRDAIAYELLQLFDLGKSAPLTSAPDDRVVHSHIEDASSSRLERGAGDLALERGEQLLSHPGGAQQPAALAAVFDFHPRKRAHSWIVHLEGSEPFKANRSQDLVGREGACRMIWLSHPLPWRPKSTDQERQSRPRSLCDAASCARYQQELGNGRGALAAAGVTLETEVKMRGLDPELERPLTLVVPDRPRAASGSLAAS